MSNKPVILQGQIEATEIRISGKLPGRIDTFLVKEGQNVKVGDTLVVIKQSRSLGKIPAGKCIGRYCQVSKQKDR